MAAGFRPGDVVTLIYGDGLHLGALTVERHEAGAVCGRFEPGPDYGAVAAIFSEWDECVSVQAFPALDEIGERIASLGIRASTANVDEAPIYDVQIYDGGGASFRERPLPHQQKRRASSSDPTV
jgi:hypothetical protein